MQFRKKSVTIEARHVGGDYERDLEVLAWCGGKLRHPDQIEPDELFVIETLEGDMIVRVGDWVIQGVQGEFYPCKPDIFVETYTLATEPVRVGLDERVIFTEGDSDVLGIWAERTARGALMVGHRSAEIVGMVAQEWVHPEDGETVA